MVNFNKNIFLLCTYLNTNMEYDLIPLKRMYLYYFFIEPSK